MNESLEFIYKYVNKDEYVICATSGGVDSMTLLYLLTLVKKKININIVCAHINHNLREESYEEFEFVKEYCNKNDIIFEGILLNKNITGNLESEFRNKRYEFFDKIVKKYNSKYLMTAHHGDDLIETILMRIVRGSSILGYAGFEKISNRDNYYILRPLIYYTKDDIYNYAHKNNIEYREDITNQSDKYTRNRYRKYILPRLKDENKKVHRKFLKFSEELESSSNFINKYVDKLLNENYKNSILYLESIKKEEDYILGKIIYKLLYKIYKNTISEISDKNINDIINIIKSGKPNISINLKDDIVAYKKYNTLEIKKNNIVNDYKMLLENETRTYLGVIKKVDETKLTNNYVCHLNSNDIKLPIYVRSRKNGDFIEVLGLNGKKKIKNLFIDEKMDIDIRDKYPIVVDSNDNILWVPGIKKSKYDRLKDGKYDIILWYVKEENDE